MRPIDGFFQIRSRRTEDYRHRLLAAFGPYCAYCESPLGSHVPMAYRCSDDRKYVELVVGAQPDPLRITQGVIIPQSHGWDNVALACDACRRAKGETPGTQEGLDWLARYNPTRYANIRRGISRRSFANDGDGEDVLRAALASWVWPEAHYDTDGFLRIAGDPTWHMFKFVREPRSQVDLANRSLVRLTQREQAAPAAQDQVDGVWIEPNTEWLDIVTEEQAPGLFSDGISLASGRTRARERVERTILGWNLNRRELLRPDVTDRRVQARTDAHDLATAYLQRLATVVADLLGPGQSGGLWVSGEALEREKSRIRDSLLASGCWTVWAKTFHAPLFSSAVPGVWNRLAPEARWLLFHELFIEFEIDRAFEAPADDMLVDDEFAEAPHDRLAFAGASDRRDDDPLFPEALAPEDDDDVISQSLLPGTDPERLPNAAEVR
ncbi:hypothetical protein M4578_12625 [Salipiger sp. P9]|uniref:HNH endonuclease n=1 Tax=Salipiger pentaromativorans TaxID=2943193 RepID=UPI002158296F|nr:hypothetical protein [Salipiger pentaromativorans]MCR8548676.1 hypothetical protein [Salipiger pentaromativorans]